MYNEYYTLRGLVLAEDKILTDGDKERLLKYLDDYDNKYEFKWGTKYDGDGGYDEGGF